MFVLLSGELEALLWSLLAAGAILYGLGRHGADRASRRPPS